MKDAARVFVRSDITDMPTILRTVTRAGDIVRQDAIAGVRTQQGQTATKFVDEKLDREFAEAVAEINEEEKALASLSSVSKGTYVGPIVAVEDYRIGQKTGRDTSQITWHDITKLKGRSLAKGDMAEISYFDGIGEVKDEPSIQRKMASAGRGVAR